MQRVLLFCLGVWLSADVLAMDHKHKPGSSGSQLKQCQGVATLPSIHCGQTPAPLLGEDGKAWFVFVQNGHIYVSQSVDEGKTFLPPVAVNTIPELIYSDGENRPKIAQGQQGEIYISWTQKAEGKYAGHIRFSRSLDGGKTFTAPIMVNDDLAPISHRFDSMVVDQRGDISIAWIDKRDLAAAKKTNKPYAGAAIYYAVSKDQGRSFEPNKKLADHSCECCRIAMDVDAYGRVIALWRHVYPTNIRDHAIAYLNDESNSASPFPVRATNDEWQVEGCPHHGPDLSVGRDNKIHLTWFTQGARNKGLMYGRFDMETQLIEREHTLDIKGGSSRPQVVTSAGTVYTAWKRFNGTETELVVSRSIDNGDSWSAPEIIAETASGSDHPMFVTQGKEVSLSWHTLAEGYRILPVLTSNQHASHTH
ncbi:MAG: glycoside hydrolase [Sedimenticola sp.]|nr:glycoside hydrolase [Sedimenticola sp.]